MKCTHYMPSLPLRDYIKYFWIIESSPGEKGTFRYAPDGHPEIFFHLQGQNSIRFCYGNRLYADKFGILGQFFPYMESNIDPNEYVFFIKFQPAGLASIFQDNIAAYNNEIRSLPELALLFEMLGNAFLQDPDASSLISVAETWINDQLVSGEHRPFLHDITKRLQQNHRLPLNAIFAKYGYSQRRIQQTFKHATGLSPKQYQRILRFRAAMRFMQQKKLTPLNVRTLGYHDWSHFSKDMRYYFDRSPSAYANSVFQNGQLIIVQA